ncbi:cell division protein [Bordetella genomosp. 4]|uniref:Cell division protein n=2 Tax=Bordetella genomosp. 4 TaxID=463044 RepID=A0A261UX67_9BORD|nr:cell division protein [Bordetella genomosp. 4]
MFPLHDLRRMLVAWLYAAALAHLLVGLTLTWAGHTGLLDDYVHHIEQAFWGTTPPEPAHTQQIWWLALFGATLQSYSLYMLGLVHIGNRYKIPSIWGWMIVGIVVWAPQDIWISLQAGIWSHLWVDSFALLVLLPPLFWLYRLDKRAELTTGSGTIDVPSPGAPS